MEAENKARELMQRFNEPTQQWDEVDGFIPHKHNAKTCALIAVDEILKANKVWYKDTIPYKYWSDVKHEIEKL